MDEPRVAEDDAPEGDVTEREPAEAVPPRASRRVALPPPPERSAAPPPAVTPPDAAAGGEQATDRPPPSEADPRVPDRLFPKGLTPIRDRRGRTGPSTAREDGLVYAGSFAAALLLAVLLYYGMEVLNPDALARTIDAQSVLYSRDPHLGAIGFIWPPLPTLARVALLPATNAMDVVDFTGQITSVFFAAGCVVVLNSILRALDLVPRQRALWVAVAMLNPVVLLHFTNGTAESAFTLLLLLAIQSALRLPTAPLPAISGIGLALAAALLVRYEAIAVAGTMAVGVFLFSVFGTASGSRSLARVRTEALLVALLFPIVFVGLMWMYFNWSIQGDPLFFYRSAYSITGAADVARNVSGHALEYAVHSIPGTLAYITERTLQVSALFIPAAAGLAWVAYRQRDPIAALILMASLSIHGMQAYQAFTGSIAPWLRYWVYLPLLTPILLAYVVGQPGWWRLLGQQVRSVVVMGVIPALFLLTNAIAFGSMQSAEVGVDERVFAHTILGNRDEVERARHDMADIAVADQIARALDETEGLILLDRNGNGRRAPLFMLHVDEPERLVTDSDRDFFDILKEAPDTVAWVLLAEPDPAAVESGRDSIHATYPDLFGGAPWLELEAEFEGYARWRLYRVVTPGTPEGGPDGGEGDAGPQARRTR